MNFMLQRTGDHLHYVTGRVTWAAQTVFVDLLQIGYCSNYNSGLPVLFCFLSHTVIFITCRFQKKRKEKKNTHSLGFCKVCNEVCALRLFFYPCKHHFCPDYVFFWINQVLEEVFVGPHDCSTLVCFRIGEAITCARLATHDAKQWRSLLYQATLFNCVALRTFRFEKLRALLHITRRH